jgi:flagellar biosynthesis protein FlhF
MRVKKFEAKSMKEALTMVKKELGPDAVILAARDNRKSFGLGGSASVEITAAISESTLQKKHFVESRMPTQVRDRFQESDARVQRQIIDKVIERRREDEQKKPKRPITSRSYIDIQDDEAESGPRRAAFSRAKGRNVSDLLEDFNQDLEADQWQSRPTRGAARAAMAREKSAPAVAPVAKPRVAIVEEVESPTPAGSTALQRIRNAAREAWKANPFMEETPPKIAAVAPAVVPASAGPVAVRNVVLENPPRDTEIASLKGEITRLQTHLEQVIQGFQKVPQNFVSMHPGADYGISYDLSFMFQKLTESGITVDNTVDILQNAAKELDPVSIKKRSLVDAWVARWFLNHIVTNQTPWQGRLHLFVGGAGSGKTSALVKMASHLVVKERKKVAILSTDSFKVGAVDQLKIYCQILNVPFAVLRSRKDWEWVVSQLNHVDHILVDFPGLQLRDLDEIHMLKSLLPPEGYAPVTHYCVSSNAKDGDAYEMARRYKVADFADLIFTNLDQSVQHGIIYNLHRKTGKALHSFGIGNRIPEDFEAATKERVLDLIFKLTKLKREMK